MFDHDSTEIIEGITAPTKDDPDSNPYSEAIINSYSLADINFWSILTSVLNEEVFKPDDKVKLIFYAFNLDNQKERQCLRIEEKEREKKSLQVL